MTNLEALKGKLSYPLSENAFLLALLHRGLTYSDTYVIANKRLLELAQADLITTLITTPNVSEGGYSVSASDKQTLERLANGIYTKYGETGSLKQTATFVSKM